MQNCLKRKHKATNIYEMRIWLMGDILPIYIGSFIVDQIIVGGVLLFFLFMSIQTNGILR